MYLCVILIICYLFMYVYIYLFIYLFIYLSSFLFVYLFYFNLDRFTNSGGFMVVVGFLGRGRVGLVSV